MLLNIRLKIHNFFKKYKYIIVAIVIGWALIIIINQYLKNNNLNNELKSTYKPDVPIMSSQTGLEIPEKVSKNAEEIIDQYISYCNNKEYEKVYEMLDEDCKKDMFPSIDSLMEYINVAYQTKKVYTIQSYYNNGTIYVFRLRIFEDILATGLTGEEQLAFWNELVIIDTSKKGICINGYIDKETLNTAYEDDNLKITVISVKKEYERETYKIKVTNRTEYPIILAQPDISDADILLKLDAEDRKLVNALNWNMVISARETSEYELTFNKYFHEEDTSRAIKFNNIRILKSYPAIYNEDGEIQNIINTYAIQVNLIK